MKTWLVLGAAVGVLILALALCAPARAQTASPCAAAGAVQASLQVRGAVMMTIEGKGVVGLLATAWRVAGGDHAPHTELAMVAFFGEEMVAFLPVTDGMVCGSLLVSKRIFDKIMVAVHGMPI